MKPQSRAPYSALRTLSNAAARVGGRIVGGDVDFDGVSTDSRKPLPGRLFVALRGERFDGHDFVTQAAAQGAAAALVDHALETDLPQWVVGDTRLALGRLAAAWRDGLPGRVVAITGSNGKTTCKEMVAAILGQAGRVLATRGNLNNDIGLPLTLLGAGDEDFLVLEMGANRPGEIGYLTDIARPEVAVITNAGRAHLEGFGSLEGVARSKGEIARGLPPDGTFVVPSDSPWTELWRTLAGGRRMLTCGPDETADVRAPLEGVATVWDEAGFRTRFRVAAAGAALELALPLAGLHNVRNALSAVALALALGVAPERIRAGLAALKPVPGRLCPRLGASGLRLIDDSYNANPDSLLAAIRVLVAVAMDAPHPRPPSPPPGRGGRSDPASLRTGITRWLVVGDMAELGEDAVAMHREIGAAAREAGVDRLCTVGELSAAAAAAFGSGAWHFPDQAALIAALKGELGAGDLVLVKGSRRAAMDRVVDALCPSSPPPPLSPDGAMGEDRSDVLSGGDQNPPGDA